MATQPTTACLRVRREQGMTTPEKEPRWLATWAGGTVPTWPRWVSADRGFHDQTVRQMLFTTAGGDAVRIRISNRHGKAGLRIGRASAGVTRRPRAADLVPGTSRPVTV